jgi:hypothetical protein
MKSLLTLILFLVPTLENNFSAMAESALKTESFDRDPKWEGFNNHVTPKKIPTVIQDFGYSLSNFAGKENGEIGGRVWRSSKRASYSAKISQKSLSDKLTASGTFAITATSGSSGAFFGWFNAEKTGSGRRDTLGFRFAGEGSGARITLQLVTDKNQACGTKVTPWIVDKTKPRGEGRKFRPTSIRNDVTRYTGRSPTIPMQTMAKDKSVTTFTAIERNTKILRIKFSRSIFLKVTGNTARLLTASA